MLCLHSVLRDFARFSLPGHPSTSHAASLGPSLCISFGTGSRLGQSSESETDDPSRARNDAAARAGHSISDAAAVPRIAAPCGLTRGFPLTKMPMLFELSHIAIIFYCLQLMPKATVTSINTFMDMPIHIKKKVFLSQGK